MTFLRYEASAQREIYHAPIFEPTIDEIAILKKLEMGEMISMSNAVHAHMSKRLLERGMALQDPSGFWAITALGRQQIRRQDF